MSESLGRPIRKFNPGTFQSDKDVIEQFVVRDRKLAIVLDVLRGNIDSPSCQHVLVVAPRGRGKTMLLARTAAQLRTDDTLSGHFLPVRFTEESHEIFNLADFWLETLFHLARESAALDPGLARELRETHAGLCSRWREQALEENARAAVLATVDRLGRKLVLMVENLQALCQNVDADFGWKLRKVLQSEPQVALLASATSRFKGLDDAHEPFFELFRIVELEPLNTEECRRLWQAVSGDAVSHREIRPLQILTGGSPRLLVIVAGFTRHRSLSQLMEELVTLIDEHTEYFRGHLEDLGKVERRVYLAVIDLWQPSRPSEIAARARMDVRVVSTMLGRLVDRGAVIRDGSGKKRLYSGAERLYSIYYKLRRERDEAAVVRNLIHFMVVFYSETELLEMSNRLTSEAAESVVIREGIDRALAELPIVDYDFSRSTRLFASISMRAALGFHQQVGLRIDAAVEEKAFDRVIEIADQAIAAPGSSLVPNVDSFVARLMCWKAAANEELGEFLAAIAAGNEVVARFGASDDPNLQWWVAAALTGKGDACGKLGEWESAITAYDEVVTRFGASNDLHLQWGVTAALVGRGDACGKFGEWESAITAYDEVVTRFGASNDLRLQGGVIAALVGRGDACGKFGEWESAITAYDEVVTRFGASDDLRLQGRVAAALVGRGDVYGKLGEWESAITTYDEVVTRFGASDDSNLQWWVACALVDKGKAKEGLGEWEAVIAAYDEVVTRFGASDDPHLQWWVAAALVGRGEASGKLGEWAAATTAYDEAVARFGASDDPHLQRRVAAALVGRGETSGKLGEWEPAITAYGEVVTRFGASGDPNLQWWVACALVDKGKAKEGLGEWAAAIAAYDEVVARFGATDDPHLQRRVAWALVDKAMRQTEIGLTEKALRTCDELERRLGTSLTGDEEIEFAWRAMCLRARALSIRGECGRATDAFRSAYAAFLPGHDAMMQGMLQLVPDLIADGASARDLVAVLSSDSTKSGMLAPLVVALREYGGEEVRAPEEVRKVAEDIRVRIEIRMGERAAS